MSHTASQCLSKAILMYSFKPAIVLKFHWTLGELKFIS